MTEIRDNKKYQVLVDQISTSFKSAQGKIVSAINSEMLKAYWEIGRTVVEFEQDGNFKAEYGTGLLEILSKDLTNQHGKGFSRSNLNYMRLLHKHYPICETLLHNLSWSHYYELLKIEDPIARKFYEKQSISD